MSDHPTLQKRSVCFVSFDAGPIIFPKAKGSIGGAETQAVLMSRLLGEDPDVDVTFVIRDSVNRPTMRVDGIRIITIFDPLFRIRRFVSEHVDIVARFPWLRLRLWSAKLIWQVPLLLLARLLGVAREKAESCEWLHEITDADFYCCMGVSDRTSRVFEVARQKEKKLILFVVSDADVDENYATNPSQTNAHGDVGHRCADAIETADVIACQTETQRELLLRHFERQSILFFNPFDYEGWATDLGKTTNSDYVSKERFVLWVGRSDRHHKRPELLLKAARQCPNVEFLMVMNTHDELVAQEIRSKCPDNVTITERVNFSEMPGLFKNSAIFVSTGNADFEGFPNVFLQAAATGVPIVTLEMDPGFITACSAGRVCKGDVDHLVSDIQDLWENPESATVLGENGKKYVVEHHSQEQTSTRLREMLGLPCPSGCSRSGSSQNHGVSF